MSFILCYELSMFDEEHYKKWPKIKGLNEPPKLPPCEYDLETAKREGITREMAMRESAVTTLLMAFYRGRPACEMPQELIDRGWKHFDDGPLGHWILDIPRREDVEAGRPFEEFKQRIYKSPNLDSAAPNPEAN